MTVKGLHWLFSSAELMLFCCSSWIKPGFVCRKKLLMLRWSHTDGGVTGAGLCHRSLCLLVLDPLRSGTAGTRQTWTDGVRKPGAVIHITALSVLTGSLWEKALGLRLFFLLLLFFLPRSIVCRSDPVRQAVSQSVSRSDRVSVSRCVGRRHARVRVRARICAGGSGGLELADHLLLYLQDAELQEHRLPAGGGQCCHTQGGPEEWWWW